MITFHKYQGAGNDFVLIDARDQLPFALDDQGVIEGICDRRFGVGADGLMLLRNHPDYDFEMVYYNSDGRPGSMCGNGGRCMVAFARKMGIERDEYRFFAVDGPHRARILTDGRVTLEMIPVAEITTLAEDYVLDTGSPHFVRFVADPEEVELIREAHAVRYGPNFAEEGINVNFVASTEEGLAIRTYERGVEDETLACGTGVTAAALVAALRQNVRVGESFHYPVSARGGQLSVSATRVEKGFQDIWLTGPAEWVFVGEIAS